MSLHTALPQAALTLELEEQRGVGSRVSGETIGLPCNAATRFGFLFLEETKESRKATLGAGGTQLSGSSRGAQQGEVSTAPTSLLSATGTHLKIRSEVSPTVTHFFSLQARHQSAPGTAAADPAHT